MFYHGTSYKNLKEILSSGIEVRKNKLSNWLNYPSRNNRVYLTNGAYALFYAYSADPKKSVIFEINENYLDKSLMGTDEDSVSTIICENKSNKELFKTVNEIDLKNYDTEWERFMEVMGCCTYKGNISELCITRWAEIDWKQNIKLECEAMNPASVVDYVNFGYNRKEICKWVFDGDSSLMSRNGIKIFEN